MEIGIQPVWIEVKCKCRCFAYQPTLCLKEQKSLFGTPEEFVLPVLSDDSQRLGDELLGITARLQKDELREVQLGVLDAREPDELGKDCCSVYSVPGLWALPGQNGFVLFDVDQGRKRSKARFGSEALACTVCEQQDF